MVPGDAATGPVRRSPCARGTRQPRVSRKGDRGEGGREWAAPASRTHEARGVCITQSLERWEGNGEGMGSPQNAQVCDPEKVRNTGTHTGPSARPFFVHKIVWVKCAECVSVRRMALIEFMW